MVTNTAVPIDPATCEMVLLIAVPCGFKRAGKAFRPFVIIGIITNEIPNIRIVYTEIM
ncbi:hypothetical protein D3C80_1772320 [compost metagenome]